MQSIPDSTGSVDAFFLGVPYKHADGQPVLADIHLPQKSSSDVGVKDLPALVYFHGGGLTVGNRTSWFPTWLKDRLSHAGIPFISVDYRLMPPATGFDLVEDICGLFKFFSEDLKSHLERHCTISGYPLVRIDPTRIAVAGTSAGGLCAYLAAVHASPRPAAILAMYAMGGNFLSPHYLSVKTAPFFRGRELLDPGLFTDFLYPQTALLEPTSDSPLLYHDSTAPIPGYPANPRMLLARLYLQYGILLDYYTGRLKPSISLALREALDQDPTTVHHVLRKELGPEHLRLFPQFHISSSWPPTMLVHGERDTAVPVSESIHMRDLLQVSGVDVILHIVPGQEHSFDYASNAESHFGPLFETIVSFLETRLAEKPPLHEALDQ